MTAPSRGGVTGSYLPTVSYTYGGVSTTAPFSTQGTGAGWFGPNAPMVSSVPADVIGRQFDFPSGYNLATKPRSYEPIGFRDLRALADAWDLLALVIETRKDQLAGMSWTIRNRSDSAKDKGDPRVKALTSFFERPDGQHAWGDWLRPILDDLFVIDAPALYVQRTRGGAPAALHQIDGATIKPVIDDLGRMVGFQQVLKGLPLDYPPGDLLYRPRNRRVHTPYGRSPVEQIVTTINIALRRQLSTLEYFTSGNMPDAIISLPAEWSPDNIVTFQKQWDAMLAGDQSARRKTRFVPATVAKNIYETKPVDLKNDFDEWLAKLVCFAFSISPQALIKQMNRAAAENQKEMSQEEGLEPLLLWLKAWIDDIIALQFGYGDLEFAWANEDEVDQAQQLASIKGYTSAGLMTIDEGRQRLGLDPFGTPESTTPMVLTATGYVPLDAFKRNGMPGGEPGGQP